MNNNRLKPSIKDKLTAFVEWHKDIVDKDWYTPQQFATILGCAKSSVSSAFVWLRRNGYIVSSRRVWTHACYVYNLRRGSISLLERQVARAEESLILTGEKLERRASRRLQSAV